MQEASEYQVDVAIIGGAFAGASAGLLLKREHPDMKILIVDRSTEPDRKVGESTSEVAGCFLTRVLRLHGYLAQNHLVKHGLRLWFNNGKNECMSQCGEIGPYYQSRMPTFQVDRATLDPHILKLAAEAGCEVWQPARVTALDLGGKGNNLLEIQEGQTARRVRARWVIDASGKAAMIARQRKTWRRLEDHPTNSIWVRLRGAKSLDSHEFASRFPEYASALPCPRNMATNHLMGRGWWCWIIPLKDGDVSVGITYDPRIFEPPAGRNPTDRLLQHLMLQPVGRELFQEATPVEKDTRVYSHLPYYTEQVAGDGWLICGDAAGFMDPLYSQGLDYCGHAVMVCVDIVGQDFQGRCVQKQLADFNHNLQKSYFRWYHALYRNKYHYLGDMDLMWAAFLLDIGTYFIGPARLVYDIGKPEWLLLPYHGRWGALFAGFMKFYNARLVKIAQKRWAAGIYGKNNLGRRLFIRQGFSPDTKVLRVIRKGIWQWLKCEAQSLFLPGPKESMTVAPILPQNPSGESVSSAV